LIIPREDVRISIDLLIEELVDGILENVTPEIEEGYSDDYGVASEDNIVISAEDVRDAIREVFDRWLEN
jgi:hypothetical protein